MVTILIEYDIVQVLQRDPFQVIFCDLEKKRSFFQCHELKNQVVYNFIEPQ